MKVIKIILNKYTKLYLLWYSISIFIILFDQYTKIIVNKILNYSTEYHINSFFNLTVVYNHGAAFSILSQAGQWKEILFIGLALIASIIIFYSIKFNYKKKFFSISLSLILGGIIGNTIDRIYYGYVIDFLDFHINYWHWPIFNIADTAITIGFIFLIFYELKTNFYKNKNF